MIRFDRDGLSFGPKVEEDHRPHELAEQSAGSALLTFLGIVLGVAGATIVGVKSFGIHPLQSMLVLLGSIYLLGAVGRPRALYLTLRSSRQLAGVADPRAVRLRLLVFGTLFLGFGLLFPWPWGALFG